MDEIARDGWTSHADEQRRAWLRLSHRERLLWLEQAKRFASQAIAAAQRRRAERATARR